MSVTTTRDITNLEVFQQQPETTVNDAWANIDKRDQILALSGQTGGTVTLTKAQALCGIWVVTGTLTSNLVIRFPATGYTRAPVVYNATTGAFTVTVSPNSGGSGCVVPQGLRALVYFDGTNVVRLNTSSANVVVGARVYNSAAVSIANNALTAIGFNNERQDTHGFHDNSTNNTRLSIPLGFDGSYLFYGSFSYAANATGNRAIQIRINGDNNLRYNTQLLPASATLGVGITVATVIPSLVGGTDYAEAVGFQDSGGALNIDNSSRMSPEFGCVWLGN